jgi:ribosomal-protein-alanine N-acetyltransferase
MPVVRLIGITREGAPAEGVAGLPEVALEACASTASLYQKAGFSPPWIGYLALCDSEVVGTCPFTAAPAAGRVEIAYSTFPAFERRGLATAMAAELIAVARSAQTNIEIFAQTLSERNASNAILCKLGFEFSGPINHPEEDPVWEWRLAPSPLSNRCR